MEATSREITKVAAVIATFITGFILFWMMPDDAWSMEKWTMFLVFTKAGGVLLIWLSCRLYERWNKTGWLRKYRDWADEADREFDREEAEQ